MALEASRVDSANDLYGSGKVPEFVSCGAKRAWLPYHLVEPTVVAIDISILIATSVIAGLAYNWIVFGNVPPPQTYLAIGVLASINFTAVLAARGDYRVINLVNFHRQVRAVIIIWSGVFLMLTCVAFLLKIGEDFSRGATLVFFAFALTSVIAWRRFLAQFLAHALMAGAFAARKVIVIGEQSQLASARTISEMRRCGYTPIRTFEIAEDQFQASPISGQLRAAIDETIKVARRERIAEILLLTGWQNDRIIKAVVRYLSVLPIPIYLLPDENVARFLDHRAINVGATWASEIQRAPLSRFEQFFKRCFDGVGAAIMLLLLSPLMLITVLLIKLESPGPALFFQTRNGFNGSMFRIVKFRTMFVLEDGDNVRQATRSDPRVTPLGRWLRRASIDELPQLFNVLKGDMSLVGPRPHAVAHNTEFEKVVANYAFRHHVKPGITGWAQVNGYRGETPTPDLMAKRVEFDLWYINNWSLWTDIRILFRTLFIGLQSSAY